MPLGSTRPQRRAKCQSTSTSRTSSRGCDAIARSTSRSAARRPARRSSSLRDLRPRPRALGERGVEQRRCRAGGSVRQLATCSRMSSGASARTAAAGRRRRPARSRCGRRRGRRPRSRRPARAGRIRCPRSANHGSRSHSPTGRLEHRRRHHLARGQPHPQVERVGQVVVGVEQVAVRRRELAVRGAVAAQRPLRAGGRAADPLASSDIGEVSSLASCRATIPAVAGDVRRRLRKAPRGRVIEDYRLRRNRRYGPGLAISHRLVEPPHPRRRVERARPCAWRFLGRSIEIVDEANRLARVDIAGVRRNVNVGLLDDDGVGAQPGDWVLIHVGFALSKVDEEEAHATLRAAAADGRGRTSRSSRS